MSILKSEERHAGSSASPIWNEGEGGGKVPSPRPGGKEGGAADATRGVILRFFCAFLGKRKLD